MNPSANDRCLRIALKNFACSRRRSLILFSLEREIRPMMGERRVMQEALFYGFGLERHVPDNHLLCKIDRFVDLSEVRRHLEPYYSETGRPSIDPEVMIRMLIVGYGLGIRSERRLCEMLFAHLKRILRLGRLRLRGPNGAKDEKQIDRDVHGPVATDPVVERDVFQLEIIPLLRGDAVRSPIDRSLQLLQQRDVLGALDVGLFDLDHHPPIRPSLAALRQLGQHILGQLVGKGFEFVALHAARLAIDMQADGISIEVEDQQG
jgi:Transposase domain (DUF772)